jgi:Flp pilus assembly protein TadG
MRWFAVRRGSERGSAMVEFALVTLLLVLIMLAGLEMNRMILVYTNLADAAKAGIRYAITHGNNKTAGAAGPGANPTAVVDLIRNYTTGINKGNLTINVTYPDGNNGSGNKVKVVMQYPYDPWVLLPLNVTLSATSQGIITF